MHVPNYSRDKRGPEGWGESGVDTILVIQPNETIWVASSPMDIGFPGDQKYIYKKKPGVCGLSLIENDALTSLTCDAESWKYKRRKSILKIK